MILQMETQKAESLLAFHLKNFPMTGLVRHAEWAKSFLMKIERVYVSGKNYCNICLGDRNIFPLPRHFSSHFQKGRAARTFRMASVPYQKKSWQEVSACNTGHSLVFSAILCSGTRVGDSCLATQSGYHIPDNRLSDDRQQHNADIPGPILPH